MTPTAIGIGGASRRRQPVPEAAAGRLGLALPEAAAVDPRPSTASSAGRTIDGADAGEGDDTGMPA